MRIIFLTGHRKSGTTLLHKLFDGHPGLNVYPVDISLLYSYLPCHVNNLSDSERRERINSIIRKTTSDINGKRILLSSTIYNCEDFLAVFWRVAQSNELDNPGTIIRVLSQAWCEYADLDTDLPFVFKETSQGIHAPRMLKSTFPVLFINLIRDPRDNYAAIKGGVGNYYSKMGEGERESLASVINRARMDLLISSQLDEQFPEESTSVRFEDLTGNPRDTMMRLANFCGVEFNEALLDPTFLGERFTGNSHVGEKFSGISNSNVGRWKDRISDFEVGVIEFWMRDVMERWGYEASLSMAEAADSFADFYNWYNCRYFYYDSLPIAQKG